MRGKFLLLVMALLIAAVMLIGPTANAAISMNDPSQNADATIKIALDSLRDTFDTRYAQIFAKVLKPAKSKLTAGGIYIWKDGAKAPSKPTYSEKFDGRINTRIISLNYITDTEVGMTLSPGTKYYFKIYAVVDGKTYTTPNGTFTTLTWQYKGTRTVDNDRIWVGTNAKTKDCTLSAVVMMIRDRLTLHGIPTVGTTKGNVGKVAWGKKGLKWFFTYGDYTSDSCETTGKSTARIKAILISRLYRANDPGGLVIYAGKQPHAIYITRYDSAEDCFYALDPSTPDAKERKLSQITSLGGKGQDGNIARITRICWLK